MKIQYDLKTNNRRKSGKRMSISGLWVTTILSLVLLSSDLMAQDYLLSDTTRAEMVRAQREKGGESGSGSFTGSEGGPNTPVRRADLFICNKSSHDMISVAYSVIESRSGKVKGWKNIGKQKCELVARRQSHGIFYAFGGGRTWSGKNLLWEDEPLTWSTPFAFCIDPRKKFEVASDLKTCPHGFTRVRFYVTDIGWADRDRDGQYYLTLRN